MEERERIREIDRQMSALKNERYVLEKAERQKQQEKLRQTVGLCFRKKNGDLVRVYDVPKERMMMTGTDFNPYQLPVLVLINEPEAPDDKIRIEQDTLFSRAVDTPNPVACLEKDYERITREEFDAELEKRFGEIRNIG